jgi:nucleoid DNA-binding protein
VPGSTPIETPWPSERMLYGTLVARLSALTGLSEEDIRKVLSSLPNVVMECGEGEQVQTPLGAFKIVRRRRKRIRGLNGDWVFAPERLQARIRPGKKLQRDVDASESPDPQDLDLGSDSEDPTA